MPGGRQLGAELRGDTDAISGRRTRSHERDASVPVHHGRVTETEEQAGRIGVIRSGESGTSGRRAGAP